MNTSPKIREKITYTSNTIRNSFTLLLGGLSVAACAATPVDYSTQMWQPIALERLEDTIDYKLFRVNHPTGYLRANGDFNGDGQPDHAEYLENRRTGDIRLVAFVSTKTAAPAQHVLDELDFHDVARMGLSTNKPGQRRTVCVRYDWPDCNVDTITLRYDSISYFLFESASSYFYYHSGTFYRLWESD